MGRRRVLPPACSWSLGERRSLSVGSSDAGRAGQLFTHLIGRTDNAGCDTDCDRRSAVNLTQSGVHKGCSGLPHVCATASAWWPVTPGVAAGHRRTNVAERMVVRGSLVWADRLFSGLTCLFPSVCLFLLFSLPADRNRAGMRIWPGLAWERRLKSCLKSEATFRSLWGFIDSLRWQPSENRSW